MLRTLFLTQPETRGDSNRQHARFAAGFSGWLPVAGLAAAVRAVLPFSVQITARTILRRLQARIDNRGH